MICMATSGSGAGTGTRADSTSVRRVDDPAGRLMGRVPGDPRRGWYDEPRHARSALRNWFTSDDRNYNLGFRLALVQ